MLGRDRRHPRLLLHPDRAAEHRPLLHLPGVRGGDHRRRQPVRRQGHGHRRDERRAAAGGIAARPRAADAGAACAAALPWRRHDRRGRARPLASPTSASAGRHERRAIAASGSRGLHEALRQHRRARPASISISGRARCSASPGPNGAGKSTLVRIIAGEERADGGELTLDGRPWSPTDDWQRRRGRASGAATVPQSDRRRERARRARRRRRRPAEAGRRRMRR